MVLIISYIFIIIGFFIFYSGRKIKKESSDLKIGKVREVNKTDNGQYQVLVSYSLDNGETFIDEIMTVGKKKHVGEDIIIKIQSDGTLDLYKGNKESLSLSFLCWVIGLVLCVFAR